MITTTGTAGTHKKHDDISFPGLGSKAEKAAAEAAYDEGVAAGRRSASASSVDAAPASIPPCVNLSPDALMSYCQSRMNSLDTQMNQIMTSQQTNATLTNGVNKLASVLNDLPPPDNSTPPKVNTTQDQWRELKNAYHAAMAQAGYRTALGVSLTKDWNSLENAVTSGTDQKNPISVSSDLVSSMAQNLKNDAATLNSGSEMSMITLQSLMSQRQTAVELTTNLIQALGQQASSITKNIGQ